MSHDTKDRDRGLHEGLASLKADLLGGDFRAEMHRRLVAAGAPALLGAVGRLRAWIEGHRGWAWPGAGVLAGAATFALLVNLRQGPADISSPAPQIARPADELVTYAVPSSKVAVIKLNFAAEVSIEDVTFEVELPEGLSFWNGGQRLAQRTFSWPGRLAAGDNLIPIAVRGEHPGRYQISARVRTSLGVVQHQLVLDVRGETG